MIVFDTNQLRYLQPPDGALLSMLRTVASQTGHTLAVPAIALEEHLAHYAHEVEELHRTATSAVRKLNVKLRYSRVSDPGSLHSAHLMHEVSTELRDDFTVLPTPNWAAQESLLREARRLAPAKRGWDGKGEGARDAAIWLTVVHNLRERDEMIYFVSMDKRAFGEGALLPDLEKDLNKEADRFKYCYGIDPLLKELAKQRATRLRATEIGSSGLVEIAVRQAIESNEFCEILLDGLDTARVAMLHGIQVRQVDVLGEPHVISYQIGGRTWACSRVRWNCSAEILIYFPREIDLTLSDSMSKDIESLEGRSYTVSFLCSTTLLMELDDNARIFDADVTHIGDMRGLSAMSTE